MTREEQIDDFLTRGLNKENLARLQGEGIPSTELYALYENYVLCEGADGQQTLSRKKFADTLNARGDIGRWHTVKGTQVRMIRHGGSWADQYVVKEGVIQHKHAGSKPWPQLKQEAAARLPAKALREALRAAEKELRARNRYLDLSPLDAVRGMLVRLEEEQG